jgi:hypothetical protein
MYLLQSPRLFSAIADSIHASHLSVQPLPSHRDNTKRRRPPEVLRTSHLERVLTIEDTALPFFTGQRRARTYNVLPLSRGERNK